MPFSMAEVVNDPDFAQSFTITRSSGAWQLGVWVNTQTQVSGYGIIKPANPEEIKEIPEADQIEGSISIHSSSAIFKTHNDNNAGLSDIVAWNSQQYRVSKVYPWQDFGYYKALATRMSGS